MKQYLINEESKEVFEEETISIVNNYFFINPRNKDLTVIDFEWRESTERDLGVGRYLSFHGVSVGYKNLFDPFYLITKYSKATDLKNSFPLPLKDLIEIYTIDHYNTEELEEQEMENVFAKKITKKYDQQDNKWFGLFVSTDNIINNDLLPETREVNNFISGEEDPIVKIRNMKGIIIDKKGFYSLSYYDEKKSEVKEVKLYPQYIRIYDMIRIPIIKNDLLEWSDKKRPPAYNPDITTLREELMTKSKDLNFLIEENRNEFRYFINWTKKHLEGKIPDERYKELLKDYKEYLEKRFHW